MRQVIVPKQLPQVSIRIATTEKSYGKDSTLERVGYVVKTQLRLRYNLAYIEEAIYQMNKEKFTLTRV